MRDWGSLTKDEQLDLRLAYQKVLDAEPRTCDINQKVDRFAAWLADQGVVFSAVDLRR